MNPGARQIAMSNSDAALQGDVFSSFNNPAGLAGSMDRELGIFYSPSPFGLTELSNAAAAYTEPTAFGTLSLGVSTFGFSLYRKNNFAAAFALRISEVSLGLSLNLHNLTIHNYGSANSLVINPGILLSFLRELDWGLSIENILNASFGKTSDQIPRILSSGFSYKPHRTIMLLAAVEKAAGSPLSFRTGIEYYIIKYISLRIGLATEPDRFSAGAGINYSFLKFDYAVFTHQDLGLTHQIGTVVNFGSNE
ncbi:MAG TPA: hypothetical protein VHO03_01180 [Ignavibacteriales bacterium]|nr:hypothetical protein [Ignavibacteriales bacterium]